MHMMKSKLVLCSILLCSVLAGCQKEEAQAPVQVEPEKEKDKEISLTFTGDLLFEQGLYDAMENYQFGTYFDQIQPYLKGDIVIGNQEVPIGGKDLGVSGEAFVFNAPEEIAQQLHATGFDVMTLANNHSYDMGYTGVVNTLNNLQQNHIETAGMYDNPEAYHNIKIIEKNGIRLALLAYTYDTNISFEYEHDYIVKTFLNEQHEFDEAHQELLKKEVAMAKEQADVVIAAMHWGNEFTYELNDAQLRVGSFLNEQGVDLIIGNHPHCLQTMDILEDEQTGNKTTVFYSLGNLVSSAAMVGRASMQFANMYEIGGIVNLTIRKDAETNEISLENMELTPIVNHFEHGYTNFALLPFSAYTEEMATKHYQREYSSNFNLEWLKGQIDSLFDGKIKITE